MLDYIYIPHNQQQNIIESTILVTFERHLSILNSEDRLFISSQILTKQIKSLMTLTPTNS